MKIKISEGKKAALKTAVIYAVFGFLWIAFSDRIASNISQDKEFLTMLSTIKGLLFIIVTATMVYFLINSYVKTIEKAEEKYHTIFDNAGDAVFAVESPGGTILDVNSTMCVLYGADKKTATGRNFMEFTAGPNEKIISSLGVSEGIDSGLVEFAARRLDGTIFEVEARFVGVWYSGKKVVIAVVRDTTERKKNEEILRRTIQELKRSNEDLQQFAAVSSHDLRQPLRTMSVYAGMLQSKFSDRLGQEGEKILGSIQKGASEMDLLISDILEYSRAGRFEKGLERVAVAGILEEIKVNVEGAAGNKAMIEYEPGSIPVVMGDRISIKQVFSNLIDNAVKFNESGSPLVKISAEPVPGGWKFTVADNGIGINMEYGEKIFKIFERLNNQDRFSGSGMGLAICKKIIERLGGSIRVESKGEGSGGSVFYFTIPS
jgi:PAS domain S-box-containing protein